MNKLNTKIIILLIIIILAVVVSGSIYLINNKDKVFNDQPNNNIKDDEPDEEEEEVDGALESLTFKEFKQKKASGEQFVLVIVQKGCGYCIEFKPILREALDELEMVGYQLDLSTLTTSEHKEFNELIKIKGTPTTLIVADNKFGETLVGSKDLDTTELWLRVYFKK